MSCSQRSHSAGGTCSGRCGCAANHASIAAASSVVAAQALGEADVAEADVEPRHELAQRPQALQLGGSVQPVAGVRALGLDEPGTLDVAQHPRRPVRRLRSLLDRQGVHARPTLPRPCQGLVRMRVVAARDLADRGEPVDLQYKRATSMCPQAPTAEADRRALARPGPALRADRGRPARGARPRDARRATGPSSAVLADAQLVVADGGEIARCERAALPRARRLDERDRGIRGDADGDAARARARRALDRAGRDRRAARARARARRDASAAEGVAQRLREHRGGAPRGAARRGASRGRGARRDRARRRARAPPASRTRRRRWGGRLAVVAGGGLVAVGLLVAILGRPAGGGAGEPGVVAVSRGERELDRAAGAREASPSTRSPRACGSRPTTSRSTARRRRATASTGRASPRSARSSRATARRRSPAS